MMPIIRSTRRDDKTAYGVLNWSYSSELEEMRWIRCALDGCGYTTPDDGHNDA
jgi:hypothetical protein